MGAVEDLISAAREAARHEIQQAATLATAGWATVTSADPLGVTLDHSDGNTMRVTPATLVAGLVLGDRVWVEIANGRAVIVGRAGGIVPQGMLLKGETSTINAATGTWTTVTGWQSEPIGRLGGMEYDHPALVVPIAGVYRINGGAQFGANSSGRRGIGYSRNGVEYSEYEDIRPVTTANNYNVSGESVSVRLEAGDAITLRVYQDSGSSLTIAYSRLGVKWENA